MSKPQLPEKWAKVLARVENMLDETLISACARIENIETMIEAGLASAQRSHDVFAVRAKFQGLEDRLRQAEIAAAATDLELAGGERMVRDYLAHAEDLRQKLADWTSRAIG